MEIIDEETRNKILNKASKHLNIIHYYDYHELSSDDFSDKYGHWGIGQRNFREIRFYPETNALIQLKKLLSPEEEYFILPIESHRKIFKDKIKILDNLFNDHSKAHVIIADRNLNWILIKNGFNKIIGIGDQIKRRIEKNIYMVFDKERIMYSLSDLKEDKQKHNEK
jgi:hypothetical protein